METRADTCTYPVYTEQHIHTVYIHTLTGEFFPVKRKSSVVYASFILKTDKCYPSNLVSFNPCAIACTFLSQQFLLIHLLNKIYIFQ